MRKINSKIYLILLILSGLLQYAPNIVDSIRGQDAVIWQLDDASMADSGALRYFKDFSIFVFAVYWPYLCVASRIRNNCISVFWYFIWIAIILCCGLVAYLYSDTPAYFVFAGLRWLFLLHAAVGLTVLFARTQICFRDQCYIFTFVFYAVAIDAAVALYQVVFVSNVLAVSVGTSRVPGLFSNAGVAGNFAVSMSLLVLSLYQVEVSKRLKVCGLCMFVAFASGSRFPMVSIFLMMGLLANIWASDKRNAEYRSYFIITFPAVFVTFSYFAYQWMINIVDRGDMFYSQTESGGRVDNFFIMINEVFSSNISEVMFGGGIGVGTNTSYTMAISHGVVPESIKFNWLVDNAFVTTLFQFGVVGSALFWFGIFVFFMAFSRRISNEFRGIFWMIAAVFVMYLCAGNPFEQFFVMVATGASIGILSSQGALVFEGDLA